MSAGRALPGTPFRLLGFALILCARNVEAGGLPALGAKSLSVAVIAGQNFIAMGHGFAETAGPVVELSQFVSRRLELGIDLHPAIWISQPQTGSGPERRNVVAFAADLILRWYPGHLGARVLPYLEIGEGPAWSPDRMPAAGTRFNFLTQAGAGLVLRTGERWTTVVGWRLVHFSNAGLARYNPSWNFNGLVVGGKLYVP